MVSFFMINEEHKKISVIMPIYNTPIKFLKEAIEDILLQTEKNIELLCIDDASTNPEILQELYKIKYNHPKQIFVISLKEVNGAANARNIGLDECSGEYVIFLDSDDRFDKDMLKIMYDASEKENSDVCICNYLYFDENGPKGRFDEFIINKTDEEWLSKVPMNPWTRLVRRKYLIDNNISFQSLSSCNDVYYAVMTLLCTDKICALGNEYFVNYRVGRQEAISANRNAMNLLKAFELIYKTLEQKNFCEETKKQVDVTLIKAAIDEWNANGDDIQKAQMYNELREQFKGKRYKSAYINEYIRLLLAENYNSKWFTHISDYFYWLQINKNKLMDELGSDNQEIYLLGVGRRGHAFLEWAKLNNIAVSGISDNELKSDIFEYGIDIVNRIDILNKSNVIFVASNDFVYGEMVNKAKSKIINLQKYCLI